MILIFLECHPAVISLRQFPKELKSHSPHVNTTSTLPPLAWSSKGTQHTLNQTSPSTPFLLTWDKSKRYTTFVFFNPVTPSWITTSGIPKSPNVKLLIVWSNLNHFLVHQHAATNSLEFTYECTCSLPTPHIYSTSSQNRVWNLVESLQWSFFAEIVDVLMLLAVFAEELRRWCLTEF